MTRHRHMLARATVALATLKASATLALAQAAGPAGSSPTFWTRNQDAILLLAAGGVITLLLTKLVPWAGRRAVSFVVQLNKTGWFGFKRRYLQAMAEEHRWLSLIGVSTGADIHPPRLRSVYISLRMSGASASDAAIFSWDRMFTKEADAVVVLGQPGAGKSTLLDYLALVFSGAIDHSIQDRVGRLFPMFARLRDLGRKGSGGAPLLDVLRCSVRGGQAPEGYFERKLERGGCVVLLDGLDEVLDREHHDHAVREIQGLVMRYPKNRYVVTCRVAGWRNQLPGFRTYEIRDLSDDDIRKFVGVWYREVLRKKALDALEPGAPDRRVQEAEKQARADAAGQAEALWRGLQKNEPLRLIARSPLILSLITLVHYYRQTDLPRGRSRLYEQCLEVLLELWDSLDKRLEMPGGPSLKDKLLVLKSVAFHFLQNELVDISGQELSAVIEPILPSLTAPISAAELIAQIRERSGILVERAIGQYAFAHRALHDYLAAAHVVENEMYELLSEHADQEPWREVILIAVGLAPGDRARVLVDELRSGNDDDGTGLVLAGLSLAEDVQVPQDMRARVGDELIKMLVNTDTGPGQVRVWKALVAADASAARVFLRDVLEGKMPELRTQLLSLLPELASELDSGFASLLLEFSLSAQESVKNRVNVLSALARTDGTLTEDMWKELAGLRRSEDKALRAAATWAWCELGRYEELGLVKVEAGDFIMGSDKNVDMQARDNEMPQHVVFLPTFYIGKYPVTAAEFQAFAEESGHSAWRGKAKKPGKETLPVTNVTWHDALAYVEYCGYTLPSEAEWEKAARGTDGRIWPWGDRWERRRCNSLESLGIGRTPVGRYSPAGDSPYGCADMAGNVWEWTRSTYTEYPYEKDDGREGLEGDDSTIRVLRGGSFDLDRDGVRCAFRSSIYPNSRLADSGFRVVSSPFSPLL